MTVFRRRLFWKIYVTLLVSLVATTVLMGTFFWFLGEAQRETAAQRSGGTRTATQFGPADVSLFADDKRIDAKGTPIALSEYKVGRHWRPGRVMRIDLPDGRFVLTRFGPPPRARALRILTMMLTVAGGVALAAYPMTALLTRRLEGLRAGMVRWGESASPTRLDDRGSDEVALLAKTFNAAAAKIDALLTSQKALLANASHELRSPLARLRVAIEVGPQDLKGGPEGASHAEIVRNLAEIDQLVDELLLSSRLNHPEAQKDRRETIDLLGLAAEEAARYDALVKGEPVEMIGDGILLRRMVRNLLENAAKHGRPPIEIAVSRRGTEAVVTVTDHGTGIAAADRERIFEPFYRPPGVGEESGGWGLGLALVRQIAERHQGRAECDTGPEGGTRLTIRLDGLLRSDA